MGEKKLKFIKKENLFRENMAACVTALKRSHDLENYGFDGLSPKRQRCSSRGSYSPKSNSLNLESLSLSNSTRSASPKAPSEFPTPKPIPDGEILERVTSIARSMKRRRELPSQKMSPKEDRIRVAPSAGGSNSSSSDSDDSTESVNTKFYKKIAKEAKSSQSMTNNQLSANQQSAANCNQSSKRCKSPDSTKSKLFSNPDTELRLTLRNVASIVESLLRQREESIREEYDKVLHEKLQEQYEIWCRYNQDQLQQHRPTSSSNYIS